MSAEELREDVRTAIRKHSQSIDHEDLRSLAKDLEEQADIWEERVV